MNEKIWTRKAIRKMMVNQCLSCFFIREIFNGEDNLDFWDGYFVGLKVVSRGKINREARPGRFVNRTGRFTIEMFIEL